MTDIGIDLGTTNILVYIKGKGIVLNEPSVVCIDKETKKVKAVGKEAKEMLGKAPEKLKVIRPMKDGVIADFDATEELLVKLIKKAVGKKVLIRPRILICCPSNITKVEKNAILEIASRLGSKDIYIEEEPKVAAIGAGMDIYKPTGSMIVDIGGGTTDIAVLSLGGIVISKSIKIAGNTFDEDIINYIKDKYKVIIGDNTAESIKLEIGTVLKDDKTFNITGRNVNTGLPDTLTITSSDICESVSNDVKKIIDTIKTVLEKTPPELCSDIKEKGIILTGGGSMLKGLVEKLRKELKIPVFISDNPLTDIAEGTGILLDNLSLLNY